MFDLCYNPMMLWIKTQNGKNIPDLEGEEYKPLRSLALDIWRNNVFQPLQVRVVDAATTVIQRERKGVTITTHLISGMVQSLLTLSDFKKGSDQSCYATCFEPHLMQMTRLFYTKESAEFLSANSVVDYMKLVETRLNEERYRVQSYLHSSTLIPLISTCEEVCIHVYLDKLLDTFPVLMQENSDSDLKRLFGLVTRVPHGVDSLCQGLQDFIVTTGRDAIKVVSEKAMKDNDSVEYCEAIIAVYRRFSKIVDTSLSKDPKLVTALDKAMKIFVNDNTVTRKDQPKNGNSFSKSPQLLAYYCDLLLKKDKISTADEADLEIILKNAAHIFRYLEDADVFMKFYQSKFAFRLVNGSSVSEEAELSMISKLLEEKGYEYTSKLKKMWGDIGVSKEMNVKFGNYREKRGGSNALVDFNVLVLTSGSWPLKEPDQFTLPKQLEDCRECFTKYFMSSNQGRKLQWLTQQGISRGELKSGCFKKSYTLSASTLQMAILMLFNKQEHYAYDDLLANTGISKELLGGNVDLLVKMKILKCDGDTKIYSINKDYKYKVSKVKIDLAIKIEVDKEVEGEKEMMRQLVIVRLMKMRKELSHNDLIAQAMQQLSKISSSNVSKIKNSIDTLIDKEYMKRSTKSLDMYEYIA